jgi:AcrR family transcriptional regulator
MKNIPVKEHKTAEQRILDAACDEFMEKGLAGARMQSIARRAKVNKALIHYYYRSKLKLYESVFESVLSRIWLTIGYSMQGLDENADVTLIIRTLVSTYLNTLKDSPAFPKIFLRELADGGNNLLVIIDGFINRFAPVVGRVFGVFKRGVQQGTLRPIDPIHIIINVMGMCAASFVLKPVVEQMHLKFQQTPIQFDDKFIAARITAITEMALHGIVATDRRARQS